MTRNRRVEERLRKLDAVLGGPDHIQQPEMRVLRFRSHGRRLIFSAIVLIAAAGAGGYFIGTFPEGWQNLLALAGLLFVVFLLVIVPYLRWLSRSTLVTTRRVIHRSGLFTRHRREILLSRIRETRVKRGIVQRMWGAGDILLWTGVDESLALRNVPRVNELSQAILDLVERQFPPGRLASSPSDESLAQ